MASVFKTILLTTDFSEASQAAVNFGRGLAEACGASLHVMNVVTRPLHEMWNCYAPGTAFLDVVEQLEAEARTRMEALVPREARAARSIVVASVWGDPSDEILKYAGEHDVDLIVCGTHGRRGMDHLVMGSVAERIVRLAPCPVLTVRGPGQAAAARES